MTGSVLVLGASGEVLALDDGVRALADLAPDEAIVAAVVGMARALGLRVVAEGVETPQLFAAVHRHGCDLAQGFLFEPTTPAAEVESLLADQPFAATALRSA